MENNTHQNHNPAHQDKGVDHDHLGQPQVPPPPANHGMAEEFRHKSELIQDAHNAQDLARQAMNKKIEVDPDKLL